MKGMHRYIIAGFFILSAGFLRAQSIPLDDNVLASKYPFVSSVFNRIFNNTDLDSFYKN
jgi:hypothetical protein